jgi:hypothetical protein
LRGLFEFGGENAIWRRRIGKNMNDVADERVTEQFCTALFEFLWAVKNGGASTDHRCALARARGKAEKLPDDLYRAAVERAFNEAGYDA